MCINDLWLLSIHAQFGLMLVPSLLFPDIGLECVHVSLGPSIS